MLTYSFEGLGFIACIEGTTAPATAQRQFAQPIGKIAIGIAISTKVLWSGDEL